MNRFPRIAAAASVLFIGATASLATERDVRGERAASGAWLSDAELSLDAEPTADAGYGVAAQETTTETTTTTTTTSKTVAWRGFLTGLEGFDMFPHPVSSPLYFHDPFIETRANLFYLWHKFDNASPIHGGDLHVWAMQLHVALTERLQLTATSDGYSRMRARILPADEGWNDLALGLKYNFYNDVADQFLISGGLSWKLSNGDNGNLHGIADELNPYLSVGKAFDKLYLMGTVGGRITMDHNQGNHILYENLHVSYELCENFYPLLEINGLQYLSDADRLPLSVGGLDYANVGSNDVAGNNVFWGGVGFRWKLHEHVELGATYEFPISNPANSIFSQRVTTSIIIGL